jgi:hypothetical protein
MNRLLAVVLIAVTGLMLYVFFADMWAGPDRGQARLDLDQPNDGKVLGRPNSNTNSAANYGHSFTESFEPLRVIETQPVRRDLPTVDAETADESLEPNDLVLGVEINGAARAYPIAMISQPIREVFNDTLGGRAIAATW